METQANNLEQALLKVVRTLPPERVTEVLDFARFLQALVIRSGGGADSDDFGEGDRKWDELLDRTESRELLMEMAREARADYSAGRTTEIDVTQDGRLTRK